MKGVSSSSFSSKPQLKIKPFKSAPALPPDYESNTWNLLKAAIQNIHLKTRGTVHPLFFPPPNSSSLLFYILYIGDENVSKEELYQAVEGLCRHKLTSSLYSNFEGEISSHIHSLVDSLASSVSRLKASQDSHTFLSEVNHVWGVHCTEMSTLRNIFLYLDRSIVQLQPTSLNLWDLGVSIFQKQLMERNELLEAIYLSILTFIEIDRSFEVMDRSLLKAIIFMLHTLHLYPSFERVFFEDSIRFFKDCSVKESQVQDALGYLYQVERRLQQSHEMVTSYLLPSSKAALLHIVEEHFLAPQIESSIVNGLPLALAPILLQNSSNPQHNGVLSSVGSSIFTRGVLESSAVHLQRMYHLAERISKLDFLGRSWGEYLKSQGSQYIGTTTGATTITNSSAAANTKEFDKTIIPNLLNFYKNMEAVLKECFRSNENMKLILKTSFESFVNANKTSNKIARLLVIHVDSLLRSEKSNTEEAVEVALDSSMLLFRVLNEKDTYEAFYKKYLSKRLLLGT